MPLRKAKPRPAAAAVAFVLLAALALLPLAGLTGCERAPAPPAWDNPFDPDGPGDGDPLDLVVTVADGQISLTWTQPQGMGIAEYVISRADDRDGPWSGLAIVPQTNTVNNFHQVADPTPTQSHWFRIQALDAAGMASLADYATPTAVHLGPRVILNEGGTSVASRFVSVKVVVSRGTSLRVALGPTYATETVHAAAAPGDTAVIALDAGPAAQGDSVRVRVIATDGTFTSAPTLARARVDFSPEIALQGGGTLAASRTLDLSLPAEGVVQMRFADSQAGLAAAAWVPGAATHSQLLLGAGTGAQEVWGEFAGDFGYNHVTHITVTPDLLAGATFRLAIAEDHVTTVTGIEGILTGKATLVRWSEGPDLAAAPWVAHDDTLAIELSPSAGLKTIYLQMRNDWNDSPILTDYAVLVSRGVEVAFVAPTDGVIVPSGATLQVRGTAYAPAGALNLVEVDLGAGFTAATGLAAWTKNWTVPVVTADSTVTLRARATAGTGEAAVTANAAIEVTITPPPAR